MGRLMGSLMPKLMGRLVGRVKGRLLPLGPHANGLLYTVCLQRSPTNNRENYTKDFRVTMPQPQQSNNNDNNSKLN